MIKLEIPKSHPRYESLRQREKLVTLYNSGIVTISGLISHGRGEAFDYILGERTSEFALESEKAALDKLTKSSRPVVSVNGNAAALAGAEMVEFAKKYNIALEANLFHWSKERIEKIVDMFEKMGLKILGKNQDERIPGLDGPRARCEREGIFSADTVLIPLEDGDRAEALKRMGKFVITVDLNPLSRTSRFGDISIVDDVRRVFINMNNLEKKDYSGKSQKFDNSKNVQEILKLMGSRLESMREWPEID